MISQFYLQHTKSDNFSIALSDVLKMIFVTDTLYLSLHWTGDTEFDDTRIWVQASVDHEKSEPVLVYNSFELASFTEKYIGILEISFSNFFQFYSKLVYFACQKSDAPVNELEPSQKWALLRYEQDPKGTEKEKANILCPEIEDVFGLKLHSYPEEDNFLVLTAALPDGFLIIFDPLMGDYRQMDRFVKKLRLPRSVVNIRIKLNQSNPCILIPRKNYMIAGVRRDIFVWDWNKDYLLR